MATTKRTVEVSLSTTGLDEQGRPQRVPLAVDEAGNLVPIDTAPPLEPDLEADHMLINLGPQHPATHGVLRLVLELDGETVVRCIPHVGYLHCGFEKIGEYRQYNQIIPYTDREDYLNSPGNNVAFALGAEMLFGIEITERCKVLRVMLCEMSRIISHLVWLGTTCIDIGAYTPFLWAFQQREKIYEMLEAWIGARLTTSLTRVGGMGADIPDNWTEQLTAFTKEFPRVADEIDRVITRNGIWVGRTVGLGAMSADEAVNYGLSGPMVRASGVAFDVRKEELRQSTRILTQAIQRLPDGPVNADDHRVILPAKSKATSDMESMIHHFKQVMEGPRPPIGECYVAVESPKGEKGYYMVSDGSPKPVRWRIRPPSFVNRSAIPRMVEGHLLSDVIAINASIDIVMGEIDR